MRQLLRLISLTVSCELSLIASVRRRGNVKVPRVAQTHCSDCWVFVFSCFQIVPHCSVGNLGLESFWPTMLRFVVGRCHLWGSNCSNCQTPARIHYDVSLLQADHFTNISPSPEVTRAHSSSKQRSAAIGKALPAARPSYLWPAQKTSWLCGCETVLFVALIVQCSYLDESANCCATAQSVLVCFFFERKKKIKWDTGSTSGACLTQGESSFLIPFSRILYGQGLPDLRAVAFGPLSLVQQPAS